jgi:hypothetical protein
VSGIGCTGHTQKNGAGSNVIKIYFSPYTGTTYTVSSGSCPSFSCATSSSLLMLTALFVCSAFRCTDLRLQRSVSFVHGLKNIFLSGASFLNHSRNSSCTVITLQNGAHRKPAPAATPSLKLVPQSRSKHEKRTAGSA